MNTKITLCLFGTLTLSSCLFDSDSKTNEPIQSASTSRVFVMTSDYSSGSLRWINDSGDSIANDSIPVHQDSYVRGHDSSLMVLERYGADNLLRLSASVPTISSIEYQNALVDNSNPMDMVFAQGSAAAYLGLGNSPYILQINRFTGNAIDSLDISAYNDPDNIHPNLQSLLLTGDTLWATLERRSSSFSNNMEGLLLVIDRISFSILDTINLGLMNPGKLIVHGNHIYVGCTGSLPWDGNVSLDSTHGIVKIDRSTYAVSILVYDKQLNGAPMAMALDTQLDRLYVVSYQSFGNAGVVYLPIGGGQVTSISGIGDATGGLAYDAVSGKLYIGDRDFAAPAVKVFDQGELSIIDNNGALPPYDIYIAQW